MIHVIGASLALAAMSTLGFPVNGPGEPHGDKNPKSGDRDERRTSLFDSDVRVTYQPGEGVTFASMDNNASLRISGRGEAKVYLANRENSEDEFSLAARRARLQADGYVFSRDVTYLIQTELTQNPAILDAVVGWRFFNDEDYEMSAQVGLQKPRSSLQFETDSRYTMFAERSAATRTFSEARAVAALVEGSALPTDEGAPQLFWHAGLMNNDVAGGSTFFQGSIGNVPQIEASTNEANEINFLLGAMFAPNGLPGDGKHMRSWREGDLDHDDVFRLAFGGNLFVGNDSAFVPVNNAVGKIDNDALQLNAFAALKTGTGVAAQTEIFVRSDDPDGFASQDSFGWYAQGSYTTAPGDGMQWGFAGRLSLVTLDGVGPMIVRDGLSRGNTLTAGPAPSVAVADGDLLEFQVALNAFYHKTAMMSQIMYTYQSADAEPGAGFDQDNHGFDILFRLMF